MLYVVVDLNMLPGLPYYSQSPDTAVWLILIQRRIRVEQSRVMLCIDELNAIEWNGMECVSCLGLVLYVSVEWDIYGTVRYGIYIYVYIYIPYILDYSIVISYDMIWCVLSRFELGLAPCLCSAMLCCILWMCCFLIHINMNINVNIDMIDHVIHMHKFESNNGNTAARIDSLDSLFDLIRYWCSCIWYQVR